MNRDLTRDIWDHARVGGSQLLVLLALADRANAQGICWPSQETLGTQVRLDVSNVRRALRALESAGYVEVTHGKGNRATYRVLPRCQWGTPERAPAPGLERAPAPGLERAPAPGLPSPHYIQRNNTQEIEKRNGMTPIDLAHAEEIYRLYPRKVGKAAAIRVIIKALRHTDWEVIRDATHAYNLAVQLWPEEDRVYVPYPATWFGQGRWEDDRTEWFRKAKVDLQNHPGNPQSIYYSRATQREKDQWKALRKAS